MLMSALVKLSTFNVARYETHLTVAGRAMVPQMKTTYTTFQRGYRIAGRALAEAIEAGGSRTAKGALAVDRATAALNDVKVTGATESVAGYFSDGCSVSASTVTTLPAK
jgi:hypothetical protein